MARGQCSPIYRAGSSEWSGRTRKVLPYPGGCLIMRGVRLIEGSPYRKLLNSDCYQLIETVSLWEDGQHG